MSKTQDFLRDRKIIDVIHAPRKLTLILDDGSLFEVSAQAFGWDVQSYGLNFKFSPDTQPDKNPDKMSVKEKIEWINTL
jgi:hypothetical protein